MGSAKEFLAEVRQITERLSENDVETAPMSDGLPFAPATLNDLESIPGTQEARFRFDFEGTKLVIS